MVWRAFSEAEVAEATVGSAGSEAHRRSSSTERFSKSSRAIEEEPLPEFGDGVLPVDPCRFLEELDRYWTVGGGSSNEPHRRFDD
jgi:hypothetical protein